MKILLTTIAFVLICYNALAQDYAIKYTYDDAGNRETRQLIFLPDNNQKKAIVDTTATGDTADKPEDEFYSDILGEQTIKVYPNPTKGLLKIEIENMDPAVSTCSITVVNTAGSMVYQNNHFNAPGTIDLSALSRGVYVMQIMVGEKTSEWKIIKE